MSVQLVNQTTGALSPIAGGTLYADAPVGTIQAYGGSSAPTGWMLCQGQALSRTTYAELFAVIGTSFGSGDGSTTFNIPDLRGEFLRGAGTNSHTGEGNGGAVGEHQASTHHAYAVIDYNNNVTVSKSEDNSLAIINSDGSHATTDNCRYTSTSSWTRLTNDVDPRNFTYSSRPTNTSVNYIIKTTSIALPTDFTDVVGNMISDNITDAITNGDTRAVTSNAVYDLAQEYTYQSYPITGIGGYITFYKHGKFVQVIVELGGSGTMTYEPATGGVTVITNLSDAYLPSHGVQALVLGRSTGAWNDATYYTYSLLITKSTKQVVIRGKSANIANTTYVTGGTFYMTD